MSSRWILAAALALASPVSLRGQLSGEQRAVSHGYRFTIPEGWQGREADGSYLLEHAEIPGVIMLAPEHYADLASLRARLVAPTDNGAGTAMQVSEGPEVIGGRTVSVIQTGTLEGAPVKAVAIATLNPDGYSVNVAAFAALPQFSEALVKAWGAVHGSVRYEKPAAAAQGDGTDPIWQQRLSGTRLTYMDRYGSAPATEGGIGGGSTVEKRIDLCPDGRFRTNARGGYTLGGADVSAAGSHAQQGHGTWQAVRNTGGALLRLRFADGRVVEHRLGWEDGRTYLDGERWFRTSRASDGDAYAPDCP